MIRLKILIAGFCVFLAAPVVAQENPTAGYPKKAVKIIVDVPAGGGVDTVTRILAEKLHERFGQPFVVENRAGAAGNLAGEAVYKAEQDGYTLLAAHSGLFTTNVALFKKLNFDPAALEPVAIMSKYPNVLVVRPDFPARTAQEFVTYVRDNPGKLTYASTGIGGTPHLSAELFQALTGTTLVYVPYQGTGLVLNDLIGGHVDLAFLELASAYKLYESGRVRILAVAAEKRLDVLKTVPTMMEVGVPDFISYAWNAISAPPKTPTTIIAALNEAINDIINASDTKKRFADLNIQPVGGSPVEMRKFIDDETRRWSEVIRRAGLQPQ